MRILWRSSLGRSRNEVGLLMWEDIVAVVVAAYFLFVGLEIDLLKARVVDSSRRPAIVSTSGNIGSLGTNLPYK